MCASASLGVVLGLLCVGTVAGEPFPKSPELLLIRLQETEAVIGPAANFRGNTVQPRRLVPTAPLTSNELEIILDAIFFKMPAGAAVDPTQIPQLISQLSSEAFAIREASADQLAAIGGSGIPKLEEAQRDDDPELRLQAAAILDRINLGRQAAEKLQTPEVNLIARQFTDLLSYVPNDKLPYLADGILARARRGSDHQLHGNLTQIIAGQIRRNDPGLIDRLAPLLDQDDLSLAAAVVETVRPRHAGEPIHPLLLKVLQHPTDAVAFLGLGPDLLLSHPNDPLLADWLASAKAVLKRNPPLESGIVTARALYQSRGDQAGLDYLRSVAGNAGAEQLALLEDIELPEAVAGSVEFMVRAAAFRKREDTQALTEAVAFLLSRDELAEIRAGISVLELLDESEVNRVPPALVWPVFSRDALLRELGKAVAMDDGVGPGGNAAILLGILRSQRFDRPFAFPPR